MEIPIESDINPALALWPDEVHQPDEDSMTEIEYQLEPKDLAAYQFATRDRLRGARSNSLLDNEIVRAVLIMVLAGGAMVGVEALGRFYLGRPLELFDYVAGVLFGAALMLALVWLHYFDQRRRLARPDGPVLGKSTLRLMREGVLITQKHVEVRYGWPVFLGITEARDLLLMWIEPGVAIAIPRSAFGSDREIADFISEAGARMAEAGLPRSGSFG